MKGRSAHSIGVSWPEKHLTVGEGGRKVPLSLEL